MAKLRINGDSSGYVDLEAPNAASSSTLDLDQVPQKNAANTFTTGQNITVPTNGGLTIQAGTNGSASLRLKNDATDWDVNCQTTDNFAIYNHTTGGNRLGITPAGIVTTPSQPSFWATSSTYATTGNYPFTNFSISGVGRFNTGSHLNLTSGVFTAPVAGKYQFNGAFHSNSTSTTARRIGRFQLNGNSLGEFMESSAQYADIGASIIVNMSANDTMQMITHPLNFDGVDFSGFLIG